MLNNKQNTFCPCEKITGDLLPARNSRVDALNHQRHCIQRASWRDFAINLLCWDVLFYHPDRYYTVTASSPLGNFILFRCTGFGLSGIAESLPTRRLRTASILRLTTIFTYVSLLGLLILKPIFII